MGEVARKGFAHDNEPYRAMMSYLNGTPQEKEYYNITNIQQKMQSIVDTALPALRGETSDPTHGATQAYMGEPSESRREAYDFHTQLGDWWFGNDPSDKYSGWEWGN